MRRIAELQPLSKDHHQALVIANRCKSVGGLGISQDCEIYWQKTQELFKQELEPHFQEEEQYLIPVLERIGEQQLLDQLQQEHALMRALVDDVGQPARELLLRFGELLANHVRFEERELFELLQQRMLPDELQALEGAR
ncbi:MAG: hemerythrin domain-containing protein [Motiliproteus sp.]|nr:hemerythrin domain-containing protein [Motiliproteus sp.]MCW9051315.1 hemerythrin domain-containing protein [Motiliproteus sp.]